MSGPKSETIVVVHCPFCGFEWELGGRSHKPVRCDHCGGLVLTDYESVRREKLAGGHKYSPLCGYFRLFCGC